MVKRIALFNNKGGMGKTTTTLNLGWMLASKGKRVILVDADPQTSLTSMILGYSGFDDNLKELTQFYEDSVNQNLKSGLEPVFESSPSPLKSVNCYAVPGREGLFLLPGHIGLSEYEGTLSIAQELSGSIHAFQNILGAVSNLLEKTARNFTADYILIDMNSSTSSFNQNILMTSDYFAIPTNLDSISGMAIDSLSNTLSRWHLWSRRVNSLSLLKEAVYPFPEVTPKFMGIVIQSYLPKGGSPDRNYQARINMINEKVNSRLVPELKKAGMMLPQDKYSQCRIQDYRLTKIPDFSPLIARSQETQSPIFALTEGLFTSSRDNLEAIYSDFANKVICITND